MKTVTGDPGSAGVSGGPDTGGHRESGGKTSVGAVWQHDAGGQIEPKIRKRRGMNDGVTYIQVGFS